MGLPRPRRQARLQDDARAAIGSWIFRTPVTWAAAWPCPTCRPSGPSSRPAVKTTRPRSRRPSTRSRRCRSKTAFAARSSLRPGDFQLSHADHHLGQWSRPRGAGSGAEGDKRSTLKLTGRPHVAVAVRTGGPHRAVAAKPLALGRQAAGGRRTSCWRRRRTRRRRGAGQGAAGRVASRSACHADQRRRWQADRDHHCRRVRAIGHDVVSTWRSRQASPSATRSRSVAPSRPQWVKFMQMDDLVRDGRPQTWLRVGRPIDCRASIAAIDGNTITLDVPLSDSFDAEYLNPPGFHGQDHAAPRLSQVGIENLHIECPPQAINHTQPHFQALRFNGEDCWVRDVVSDETMNSVSVGGRRITVERVAVQRKGAASRFVEAGRVRPQRQPGAARPLHRKRRQRLVSRPPAQACRARSCCSTARSPATAAPRRTSAGRPDCSTTIAQAPGGGLDFRNRGSMGSGHGWTMGWGVAWNCEAKDYIIQNPPGATNWMIGCIGASTPMPRPFGTESACCPKGRSIRRAGPSCRRVCTWRNWPSDSDRKR